jgi:hypothetical protein
MSLRIPARVGAALCIVACLAPASDIARAVDVAPGVGVGPQYDSTHVYVTPDDTDRFVTSIIATFGGRSTKKVVATVTPTPRSTTSQLIQTPVGIVSLFRYRTPIPYPFGAERTGFLVTDMSDGREAAMVQFPGGYIVEIVPPPASRPLQRRLDAT